jgi:hypothetical protein
MAIFDQASEAWEGLKDPLAEAEAEAETQTAPAPTYELDSGLMEQVGTSGISKILLIGGGLFVLMMILGKKK